MTTPFKFGSEFRINTATISQQNAATLTALADGRFVAVWVDGSGTGADTSATAVRAQFFNADGSKAGGEFLVNTTTAGFQNEPTVTSLADGRFVIAWTDSSASGGDTSGNALRAQIYNSNGTRSGGEFLANTTTLNSQYTSSITALADGSFVLAWQDTSGVGDTSGTGIRGQHFSANGVKLGAEFLINTTTINHQLEPSITALADGGYVVAWTDYSMTGADTSNTAIRAQVFNATGAKLGAEFVVNSLTWGGQYNASVAALTDGRFV
ncbi:MAG: hypothetical protein WCC57_12575, partial [Paracoccaceae bacterium]